MRGCRRVWSSWSVRGWRMNADGASWGLAGNGSPAAATACNQALCMRSWVEGSRGAGRGQRRGSSQLRARLRGFIAFAYCILDLACDKNDVFSRRFLCATSSGTKPPSYSLNLRLTGPSRGFRYFVARPEERPRPLTRLTEFPIVPGIALAPRHRLRHRLRHCHRGRSCRLARRSM